MEFLTNVKHYESSSVVTLSLTSFSPYCVISLTLHNNVGYLSYVVTLLDTVPSC